MPFHKFALTAVRLKNLDDFSSELHLHVGQGSLTIWLTVTEESPADPAVIYFDSSDVEALRAACDMALRRAL